MASLFVTRMLGGQSEKPRDGTATLRARSASRIHIASRALICASMNCESVELRPAPAM